MIWEAPLDFENKLARFHMDFWLTHAHPLEVTTNICVVPTCIVVCLNPWSLPYDITIIYQSNIDFHPHNWGRWSWSDNFTFLDYTTKSNGALLFKYGNPIPLYVNKWRSFSLPSTNLVKLRYHAFWQGSGFHLVNLAQTLLINPLETIFFGKSIHKTSSMALPFGQFGSRRVNEGMFTIMADDNRFLNHLLRNAWRS